MKLIRCCLLTLMLVGLVVFVGSLTMYFLFPEIVATKVKEQLPLRNGSASLKNWSKVTVPIYLKVYVFDVTNGQEVATQNAVPIVEERGPYTFLETREKVVLGFNNDSEVIDIIDIKKFYFAPELSNGTLEDEVSYINVPLIGMIQKIKNREQHLPILGNMFSNVMNNIIENTGETVIAKRTVGELLFEGYKVNIFDRISDFAKRWGISLPPFLPNNTFGVMYGKNGTSAGIYSINTGVGDIRDYNKIEAFRGRTQVPHWNGESCNAISGTDGSGFHPQVTRDELIYVFNTDLCRSLVLDYEHDSEVRGIPTFKYTVPERFFQAPASGPDNECYCTQPGGLDNPLCQVDGILDISKCRKGAPIILSAPHFYQGDPELRLNVSGLRPDKRRHETFLEIEPLTGLVLNAARRIQINVHVKNFADTPSVVNVNDMIMPVLWLEEVATADEPSAQRFKALIQNKLVIGSAILISGVAIGLAVFLIALAICIFKVSGKDNYSKAKEAQQELRSTDYSTLPQKEPLPL